MNEVLDPLANEIAQAFWIFLGLLVLFLVAGLVQCRIDRKWLRRLQSNQDGRRKQAAEWLDKHTWKGPKE